MLSFKKFTKNIQIRHFPSLFFVYIQSTLNNINNRFMDKGITKVSKAKLYKELNERKEVTK